MHKGQEKGAVFDRALTGIFFTIIFLPAVLSFVPWSKVNPQLTEKRRLAERPAIPLSKEALISYPRQFEKYYDDHFPFRTLLIQAKNYLSIRISKKSDQNDVLMGREGWLFFSKAKLLQDFIGWEPFMEEELEGVRRLLEAKRDWLAARGVAYIFVIPPNKQSIYAEYMPEHISRARGRTRLDQLVAYIQAHSDVTMIDLRPSLLAAKSQHQLYYRYDTHWNNIGGLIAYGEIMRAAKGALKQDIGAVRTLKDYTISRKPGRNGDLAAMLGLNAYFTEDEFLLTSLDEDERCAKKLELKDYLGRSWEPFSDPFAMVCPRARGTMLVFRDSFMTKLVPYLSEHFRRSVFVWTFNYTADVFKAAVEKEQPDLVIDECVERGLGRLKTEEIYRPRG